MIFHIVPPLGAGQRGDPGLMSGDSITWRVARERVVTVFGGGAATLLQIAHPLVAQGVHDHSNFTARTLERLTGTLSAMLTVTFGDSAQAHAMAKLVQQKHLPVHGKLQQANGRWRSGAPYSALNAELALWVYATIVQMALQTYSEFVQPLSLAEREAYYQRIAPLGALFGVKHRPKDYIAFVAYYTDMLGQLQVGQPAMRIARDIFTAHLGWLPAGPFVKFVTIGALPPEVRAVYGLAWRWPQRTCWAGLRWLTRHLLRVTPKRLRFWSHYFVGKRRLATA